jgi:DNA-binding Xre family transcriptional regulator
MTKFKINIKPLAAARDIHKAHTLQNQMRISPSKAARLWKGDMVKIEIATINELCSFFKCTPGDLFETVKVNPRRKQKQISRKR